MGFYSISRVYRLADNKKPTTALSISHLKGREKKAEKTFHFILTRGP